MEFDFDSDKTRQQSNAPEFTVSELSGKVKNFIESEFSYVRVRGELGRVSTPASGHVYLDLKDDKAVIAGVIWRAKAASLAIRPEQGLEVIVSGKLTTFPGQSKYQIVIDKIEPAGQGALMALLEERKKKLAAEGLFDESAKAKLPFMPRVIGIVTSPTGAVIRDMMHGFRERFPVHVMVWPVRVQGETAAREIAAAIAGFNRIAPGNVVPRPDVLIVARGGGSLEDLWSFNEEIVARAAAASRIPLISAVGHETDWTLIDYVADARAPTPTKAAEWAVPKYSELMERMGDLKLRQLKALIRQMDMRRSHLKSASRGLPRLVDLVGIPRQRLDGCSMRLAQALTGFTRQKRGQYQRFDGRLRPHLLVHRLHRGAERVELYNRAMRHHMGGRLRFLRQRLAQQKAGLRPQAMMTAVVRGRAGLEQVSARHRRAFAGEIARRRQRLHSGQQLLKSLSYQSALARGFALVRDEKGEMVRGAAMLKPGAIAEMEFVDGRVLAEVKGGAAKASKPALKKKNSEKTRRAAKKRDNSDGGDDGAGGTQGSLF